MERSGNRATAGLDPQVGLRCHHCAGPLTKDMVITIPHACLCRTC